MPNRHNNIPWWYLTALLAANLTLLLSNANPLRVAGAIMLIGFLPGLGWASRFFANTSTPLRWIIAAALSYTITSSATLLLHYLPGPVLVWQLLAVLNAFAILPIIAPKSRRVGEQEDREKSNFSPASINQNSLPFPLLLILAIALFLRIANLHYSEFQGDEALAMISTAEALEGHKDALFLRSKGPGELLLPMALWRLTGTISEPIARLPFTIAALFAIVTVYLTGQAVAGERTGWIAAGFFAFNGFIVAFGRIVQYQALVVWMSALAVLLIIRWRANRQYRYALVGGLTLGTGLLAHYDAILVLPAIIWLFVPSNLKPIFNRSGSISRDSDNSGNDTLDSNDSPNPDEPEPNKFSLQKFLLNVQEFHGLGPNPDKPEPNRFLFTVFLLKKQGFHWLGPNTDVHRQKIVDAVALGPIPKTPVTDQHRAANYLKALFLFFTTFLLISLTFYLPYFLDPQANRTGAYVGGRIGNELRNNLPDFFHFNTFYSSAYYIIITGLLVLGLLAWLLWHARWHTRWSRWLVSFLVVTSILFVITNPNLLVNEQTPDLSFLPFALVLTGAFFAVSFGSIVQALIIWLAIPFLGYNFVVALGLTHIYTIVPAWSLLAAMGWFYLFDSSIPGAQSVHDPRLEQPISPNHGSGSSKTITNSCPEPSRRGQSPIPVLSLVEGTNYPPRLPRPISNLILTALLIIATIFLWNAFVRHDVEYWQDYPAGNLSFYWNPYVDPPKAGFFGFAHRTGWKAVGQQIASGKLAGDYGSNEEPDVTTWYTRGAPRACDPQPEFYFLADDLIDPVAVPDEVIDTGYKKIGNVTLPNGKQMQIMQQLPNTIAFETTDEFIMAQAFDSTATPASFARSARGARPAEANFGNLVQLIGYDLDTRRAYPGGRVPVTLYWQALASIPTSYQIFTHLESEAGPVAQSDGVPVCWTYPTDAWRPGQIIADQHAIILSPDTPPGEYPLEIGLYLPDTFERLDILDDAGNPAGTSVTLATVEIMRLGD